MEAGKRIRTKTRTITAKVTVEEEAAFRDSAQAAGLTASEWARRSLLSCVQISAESRLLLNELMAIRMVFLGIQVALLEQDAPALKDQMAGILDKADKGKIAAAEKRIQAWISGQRAALPDTL